ncbi:hypothetical protein SDC9_104543 [bioreactor metagenome]|uniref:Uncharacterized protein n=1 Tax=bioreactor metagenome TaxID=1076179 RepID=A0A645AX33_9ZZZZ
MVYFPFHPGTPVHPNAAILVPLIILHQIDGGQNSIQTYFVGSVRIGEVAGNIDLMRFDAFNKVLDDYHVSFRNGVFFYPPGFVKRQVEKMYMAVW